MGVTLYMQRECHECGLVRRLLRQYAVPFEAVALPLGDKAIVRERFGTESVPVLVDGSFTSSDLNAITHHVERKYGGGRPIG